MKLFSAFDKKGANTMYCCVLPKSTCAHVMLLAVTVHCVFLSLLFFYSYLGFWLVRWWLSTSWCAIHSCSNQHFHKSSKWQLSASWSSIHNCSTNISINLVSAFFLLNHIAQLFV